MTRIVRAVIFDFDGTILDTEWPEYTAWSEAYQSYGVELGIDIWAKVFGTSGSAFDLAGHLEKVSGQHVNRHELRARIYERSLDLILASPLMPGVIEYIEAVQSCGLPLAIASTSPCGWVEGHLERLGLSGHFPVIRCADWVENVKPAPDLYLSACAGLGLDPADAIAFEDSPNGITAANRAGVFSIAVPNRLSCMLDLSHADHQVETLQAVPFDELLRQIDAVTG